MVKLFSSFMHKGASRAEGLRASFGASRAIHLALLGVLGLFIASCSTNPATGEKQFTAFMPAASEASVGAGEHSKILAQYGAVDDAQLRAMVTEVGGRIVPFTERPDVRYTFTVLDTPDVNAFALPGGYVYVTRGLLALANNEAELAAVIAHEIGHVTARHSAERYSRSVATGLGTTLLSVLLDSDGANDLLGLGSNLYLSSYSRTQEHQADTLGIRYITQAGYDPYAMASFLTALERNTELKKKEMGSGAGSAPSYFSTHPVTQERVSKTLAEAGQQNYNDKAVVNHEGYLNMLQNLVYGDSAAQGFVHTGRFVHPKLGFAFTLPKGFTIQNGAKEIAIMSGKSNALALADSVAVPSGQSMETYLRTVWLKGKNAGTVENRVVNGHPTAIATQQGTVNGKAATLVLAAVQWKPDTVFRFHLALPSGITDAERNAMMQMVSSFQTLSAEDAARLKPKRLVVFESSGLQNVSKAAAKMPFDDGLNDLRFRVLNGLSSSDALQKGRLYKTIVQ